MAAMATRERWIDHLLERVGIAEAGDRRTSTYSGGMRQRLGIAQALVGRPAVILLDEPVSALDPIGRKDVLDLMRELKGETTVFYSTHILDDVQRVSDHVAILDHGRLVKAAPTQVLLGSFTKDTLKVVLGGADDATTAGLRELAGVASVAVASAFDGETSTFDVSDRSTAPSTDVQRSITGFAVVGGPDPHRQHCGDARSRDRLPAPHRSEGSGSMNAQSLALGPTTARASPGGGMFLGFGTFFRKEVRDWVRGRRGARCRSRRARRSGPHDAHSVHRQHDRSARQRAGPVDGPDP